MTTATGRTLCSSPRLSGSASRRQSDISSATEALQHDVGASEEHLRKLAASGRTPWDLAARSLIFGGGRYCKWAWGTWGLRWTEPAGTLTQGAAAVPRQGSFLSPRATADGCVFQFRPIPHDDDIGVWVYVDVKNTQLKRFRRRVTEQVCGALMRIDTQKRTAD